MKEKLEKAKLRKKALFDNEYDAGGNSSDGKTFFDEWKSEMELQAKVCATGVTINAACNFVVVSSLIGVISACLNKKHLKNVGPIRHSEPPHTALPFTRCRYCRVAHRLRIDVHDDNDNA